MPVLDPIWKNWFTSRTKWGCERVLRTACWAMKWTPIRTGTRSSGLNPVFISDGECIRRMTCHLWSKAENLQLFLEAYSQPFFLKHWPRQVRNLVVCLVFQQWRLVVLRPLPIEVPDVGLGVVAHWTDVVAGLGSPCDRIHTVFVVFQLAEGNGGFPELPRAYRASMRVI